MAYYGYYQQAPHWGQPAYATQYNQHFIAPPVPTYQPQPTWTGQDYYSAHYRLGHNGPMDNSDVGLFDYVWSRLKGLVGAQAATRTEARHWHRRVYGGYAAITSLLPSDLGAAAGYEAFRLFNYHKSVYRQPLMDDWNREEEALAGLAIAEATKLWSYCQRPADKYGRREACEVAAATAERLLRKSRRDGTSYDFDDFDTSSSEYDGYGHSRGRSVRRRSSGVYGTVGLSPYVPAGAIQMPSYQGQIGYTASPSSYTAYSPTTPVNYPTYGSQPVTYTPAYAPAPTSSAGVGGLVVPAQRPRASSFTYPNGTGYY